MEKSFETQAVEVMLEADVSFAEMFMKDCTDSMRERLCSLLLAKLNSELRQVAQ